jgi:putative DNA primase/helicase
MGSPQSYLNERGILEATAEACGVQIELGAGTQKIPARLGFGTNGVAPLIWPHPEWAICFPLPDATGTIISYTARLHPPALFGTDRREAKFVHSVGLPARPFITWPTWEVTKRTDVSVIVTEGPIRGLLAHQCRMCAIALAGVYNIADKRAEDQKLVLHSILRQFAWTNRTAYLAFDMDFGRKEQVLKALIRNIFLLHLAGAVVKILQWGPSYKGLDDYLAFKAGTDPDLQGEALQELVASSRDAFEFIIPPYLEIVCRELDAIVMSESARSQLANRLHDKLGVTAASLRREEKKTETSPKNRAAIFMDETIPSPVPVVDGALLLDRIEAAYKKHIVMDEADRVAVTLWTALDFLVQGFYTVPFLTVHSPIKRCGKTNLLTVLRQLGWNTVLITNLTTASMFRVADEFAPTMLIDEAETFLKHHEELRGILNAGHKRADAFVLRFNNELGQVEKFSTFCPKAIALIGKLHETLVDRSIVINLRRRLKTESITPIRYMDSEGLQALKADILRWTKDHQKEIWAARPTIPRVLHDRAAENWEPLLAIADIAGDEWPERARVAATLKSVTEDEADSVTLYLFSSMRRIWQEPETQLSLIDGDFLRTEFLITSLNEDKTSPWADWSKGAAKGLTARKLSDLLREYEVRPVRVQVARGDNPHGYRLSQLQPLFARYLDPEPPPEAPPPKSSSPKGPPPKPAPPAPGPPESGSPEGRISEFGGSEAPSDETPENEKTRGTFPEQTGKPVAGDLSPSVSGFNVQPVSPKTDVFFPVQLSQSPREPCCTDAATGLALTCQLHLKPSSIGAYEAATGLKRSFWGEYTHLFIDTETYCSWPPDSELTPKLRNLKKAGLGHPDAGDWR